MKVYFRSANIYRTGFAIVAFLFLQSFALNLNSGKFTIYVIGDSTACNYDAGVFPRTGWAQVLQPFFNKDSVTVNNQAASGRSSKSFYNEGRWKTVYNMLKPGDYVFIQFAHNDEKTEDTARYTIPSTTFKQYLTIFINQTKEKGAFPVLLTSIPRNNWSGSGIQKAHTPYSNAMKELATSYNIPLIDMETIAMDYLNSKGKTYATDSVYNNLKTGIYSGYPSGNSDGTHLQEKGAFELCKALMPAFKNLTSFPEMKRLSGLLKPAVRVSAMPTPNLKGTIRGAGVYTANSKISLTATAASGYRFVKWTRNYDTISLSNYASYSLQLDSLNINLLAHFQTITGMNQLSVEKKLSIYPNPAKSHFFMNIVSNNFKSEIYDTNGKLVKTNYNEHFIDVSNLRSGHYIVKTISEKDTYLNKIEISR